MTRLLIVANWLDDLGGVQTATRSLADALRAAGADVALASVFGPSERAERDARSHPVLFPITPWRVGPTRLRGVMGDTRWGRIDRFARARAIRRLEALARGVDAVIAMDVFACEVLAEADLGDARRFLQYHNTFSNIDGTRDLERVLRAAPDLDAIVALTESDAEGFRARTSVPVRAISNALSVVDSKTGSEQRLIIGLGRYTTTKNFALLLDAWNGLSDAERASWRIELHGDGPERAALERRARAGVQVLGPTAHPTEVLRRAAILVLPSVHEGLPMVLLEAMSHGVACIATRSSPGVSELLGDGAGWLVPVGDEDALRRSLLEAMRDPELRATRTRAARDRLQRYAPASVAARWLDLLTTLRRAA